MTYPKMGYEKLPDDCADRDAGGKESIGIGYKQELTASLIPEILHSWKQRVPALGAATPLEESVKNDS